VPDYGIVGGNPARLIRKRFSDAEIERLLAVAWWDWPPAKVTRNVRSIMSGSIAELENAV
jgi:virginiamycin A acetyltransferase